MNRRPTSIDIAAHAGVSQATVSRVLNQSALVSDTVRRRVMDAAQKLHYKVDSNARRLRSSKIQTLALLILEDMENEHSDINPFFLPMVGSIVKAAADKGYELVISLQRESNDWGADYCLSRPAEGIIFLGSKDFDTYVRNFRSHNHSDDNWVVWGLNRTDSGKTCVVSDNEGGVYEAIQHLVAQGRKRIAYIGKLHSDHWEFIERYQGYRRALHDAGIAFDEALTIDSQLTLEDGVQAAERLIASGVPFDAVFASTDMLALGAMRQLMSKGYRIPHDIAVMGFDDLWVGNAVWPPLSTVRQNTRLAGEILVDSVCALIEGTEVTTTRIPTQLVIRESCGAKLPK
jgi:DNA-binding LacI/PurR family transcriptional regulator